VQLAKRVHVQRFVGSAFLESFLGIFADPADSDAKSILEGTGPSVDELIRFPAAFQGEGWLTPAEVWGA
jgi:hypothetical protein